MSDPPAGPPSKAPFPTTRWSRVVAAGDPAAPEFRAALAELCQDYWYPIYAFVRRKGYAPEEAEDLVQGLFTSLLERGDLRGVDPARGRFRSFLMACCSHYLADRRDHDRAARRSGGRALIPIDRLDAEARYRHESSHEEAAERIFDRQWALTLLGRVLGRLGAEAARSRHARLFEKLRPMLEGDHRTPTLRQVAAELGLSEGAVRVAAHRLRSRYRELLTEELARTALDGDVEQELKELLAALRG